MTCCQSARRSEPDTTNQRLRTSLDRLEETLRMLRLQERHFQHNLNQLQEKWLCSCEQLCSRLELMGGRVSNLEPFTQTVPQLALVHDDDEM